MNEIKKLDDASEDLKGNAEIDIQEMTDAYVKRVDDIFSKKETEIMTV
jgi:ribosome recycling factor